MRYFLLFLSFSALQSCTHSEMTTDKLAQLLVHNLPDKNRTVEMRVDTTKENSDTLYKKTENGVTYSTIIRYAQWFDMVGDGNKQDCYIEFYDEKAEKIGEIPYKIFIFKRGNKKAFTFENLPYNDYQIANRNGQDFLIVNGHGGGSTDFGSACIIGLGSKGEIKKYFDGTTIGSVDTSTDKWQILTDSDKKSELIFSKDTLIAKPL